MSGGVLAEVATERRRQDEKWGEQNPPDGTGPTQRVLSDISLTSMAALSAARASELARAAQLACEARGQQGEGTWTAILLEEVFEALAEDDPVLLRTELIQVAAVATQWVEAIDRRTGREAAA